MDDAAKRFREAADRENRGRRTVRRRYSTALQARAVRYCRRQARQGTGLRVVAVALGVAPWSLYRWMQRSRAQRGGFRPVAVVDEASVPVAADLVLVITPTGPRVEGLDVERAARLLALLR
jgi:transposase-like protein